MCLPIAVKYPDRVLATGVHAGHEWVVTNNGRGFRCGYTKVEAGHPWHGKDYSDIEADVHGGLTFGEPDAPCDKGGADTGHWFGFDCAHCYDPPDLDLPSERPELTKEMYDLGTKYDSHMGAEVRTQEYVEDQCRRLCEQAAAATIPFAEAVA